MCELKVARGKKIYFSPHQKLFHLTRTKRNFILVQQAANGTPPSVKLYGSSAIHGLLEDHREARALAVDDWDLIQKKFLGIKPN
jgi:hypothetical protein